MFSYGWILVRIARVAGYTTVPNWLETGVAGNQAGTCSTRGRTGSAEDKDGHW